MWTVIVFVLAVAFAIYSYLAYTRFFTEVTFMAAYRAEFDHSGSHEAAIRTAMNVFAGRPPFNALGQSDLEKVVRVFASAADARLVAKIVRAVDKGRIDIPLLRNQEFLDGLEKELQQIGRSPP